jgi:hypothetical protein
MSPRLPENANGKFTRRKSASRNSRGVTMKYLVVHLIVCVFGSAVVLATCKPSTGQSSPSEKSPEQVVEQLWKAATEGQLLTPEGWDKASRAFFADHLIPSPGTPALQIPSRWNKPIHVVSNNWGVMDCRIEGTKALVAMEYYDAGVIDPMLWVYTREAARAYGQIVKPHSPSSLLQDGIQYSGTVGNSLIVDKIMTGPKSVAA